MGRGILKLLRINCDRFVGGGGGVVAEDVGNRYAALLLKPVK